MCGITGVFERARRDRASIDILQNMCRALTRRGPDDEGYFVDQTIGLGMRRLSIIDVAGGHQPIWNEDRSLCIVFNGEIFNHEELAADLKTRGHSFQTRSDTEAILHLYEEQGPSCLNHLRGMFAIAIWDTRARRLFVARDRLGIKPLYYFDDGSRFIFGSEIKAILEHPAVAPGIDWTAIDAYFALGYVPAPWTAYKGIRKLLPGHYLLIDDARCESVQYWDLSMGPKLTGSERDLEEEFIERFSYAVKLRLLSEVPLGAFLSGGLDSSLLVAAMHAGSGEQIKTFTIGFGGGTGNFLDERPIAREVAARFNTEHHEFEVVPRVQQSLDVAVSAFDEPFADDSLIPTHHICALASDHVTVALTGLGGDEALGGYERYLGLRLSSLLDRPVLRQAAGAAHYFATGLREEQGGHYRINHMKRFLDAQALSPARRWQRYIEVFPLHERRTIYQPHIAKEIDFEAIDGFSRHYFDANDSESILDRAMYQDIKLYLPDDILALTDRVGMWHSLELRVPFVDHLFLEFCARLPVSLKIRLGQKKYLMRRVAKRLLPRSVLAHRKQGFAAPLARWLRGDLKTFVDDQLSRSAIGDAGVLQPEGVIERLRAHHERRRMNDKQIFALLMFHRWLPTVTSRRSPTPANSTPVPSSVGPI